MLTLCVVIRIYSSLIPHPSGSLMPDQKTLFSKLKRGLFMTHTEIIEKVKDAVTPDLPIDRAAIERLEEGLLGADVGAELSTALVNRIEQRIREENIRNLDRLTAVLREETRGLIPSRAAAGIDVSRAKPFVILVVGVNGTTGPKGVSQASPCLAAARITGMIATKLDGTAKGGVILSIMRQFDIPVKFVGVGEGVDDLIPFDPNAYVDTLFE